MIPDIIEKIACSLLQRHALLVSIEEARKEAVSTLAHTYGIIQQDYLLGLDFDQPFTGLTDSVAAVVLMRCGLEPPLTRAWCDLTRRDRERLARDAQGRWASEDPNTFIDHERAWLWANHVADDGLYYDLVNYDASDLELLESLQVD